MPEIVVGVRQEGPLGMLDFPNDVTAQTREAAYSAYHQLALHKARVIAFNFSATDYLNSAGIGLVISLVEDALHAGRRVYGYGLNAHNRKLFRMVGLAERMVIVADEGEMRGQAATAAGPET
jgi:anti-anti-sigma regulatory factor